MEKGFVGKVTKHKAGMYLRIPEHNVKFSDLQNQDLLHIQITNQHEKSVEASRKIQITGSQAEIYLPKNIKEQLDLEHGDRVSVLYRKD